MWCEVVAQGATVAHRAWRSGWSGEKTGGARIAAVDARTTCNAVVNRMVLCSLVRLAVCMDGVTESATEDGNSHSRWH